MFYKVVSSYCGALVSTIQTFSFFLVLVDRFSVVSNRGLTDL